MSEVEGSIVTIAGTVLNKKDVINAKLAGAKFIVSPGFTQKLLMLVKRKIFLCFQEFQPLVEVMQI